MNKNDGIKVSELNSWIAKLSQLQETIKYLIQNCESESRKTGFLLVPSSLEIQSIDSCSFQTGNPIPLFPIFLGNK